MKGKKEEMPVQEKTVLFELLDDTIGQEKSFCKEVGIDLNNVTAIIILGVEDYH